MEAIQGAARAEAEMTPILSETELAAVAAALAGPNACFTAAERCLLSGVKPHRNATVIVSLRKQICAGADPLGEAFCRLRSPVERRAYGATYTPFAIVQSMVDWAAGMHAPARIVDPGAGSGRFLLTAARRFPEATLVAVETDPLAVLMLRANAAALGVADRLTIELEDYRRINLPKIGGPTLFIGNPPYLRHHDIPESWKTWFAGTAAAHGFKASKLAGLHIHFFLKTRQLARRGDYGAFITSAEWLDVNYGSVLRKLLTNGLGGVALHVLAPATMPFADANTTGAITCFSIGSPSSQLTFRAVNSLDELDGLDAGKAIRWSMLDKTSRWSTIIRPNPKPPRGYIELGEICRVHRGQVTGSNEVWIAGAYSGDLPGAFLFPCITRAKELFKAGPVLESGAHLRKVIDLPVDLDKLGAPDRAKVDLFLEWARRQGADLTYIAKHRRAWWSVGLKNPAPILCTYMARRPPAFVRNRCGARHVNIAHGLYPLEPLSENQLTELIAYLRAHVRVEAGRTYAGGLTKFEPKEVERIPIPRLDNLHERAAKLVAPRTGQRRGTSEIAVSQGAS